VREGRISKLVAMMATCRAAISVAERKMVERYGSVSTTAFTNKPVSMKYRGIFELYSRKEGRLQYTSKVREMTPQEIYQDWFKRFYGNGNQKGQARRPAAAEERRGDVIFPSPLNSATFCYDNLRKRGHLNFRPAGSSHGCFIVTGSPSEVFGRHGHRRANVPVPQERFRTTSAGPRYETWNAPVCRVQQQWQWWATGLNPSIDGTRSLTKRC